MLLVAGGAFDGLIVTEVGIGLELGREGLYRIAALMALHAGLFLGDLAGLDVAVAGFARKVHGLVRPLERHVGGGSRPGGHEGGKAEGGAGRQKNFRSHCFRKTGDGLKTPLPSESTDGQR